MQWRDMKKISTSATIILIRQRVDNNKCTVEELWMRGVHSVDRAGDWIISRFISAWHWAGLGTWTGVSRSRGWSRGRWCLVSAVSRLRRFKFKMKYQGYLKLLISFENNFPFNFMMWDTPWIISNLFAITKLKTALASPVSETHACYTQQTKRLQKMGAISPRVIFPLIFIYREDIKESSQILRVNRN
jgi:hypothetical protein